MRVLADVLPTVSPSHPALPSARVILFAIGLLTLLVGCIAPRPDVPPEEDALTGADENGASKGDGKGGKAGSASGEGTSATPSGGTPPATNGPAVAPKSTCDAGKPCVVLVVDKALYEKIREPIARYASEVAQANGVSIAVDVGTWASATPDALRAALKTRWTQEHIEGAILVGRLPYAQWEQSWDGPNSGLNSFYYEDLDGTFTDADGNGKHDTHGWGKNPGPEIWVSFLYPSKAMEAEELTAFFEKSHKWRAGELAVRKRGLVTIHSDWARDMTGFQNYYGQLEGLYGKSAVDWQGGYDGSNVPIKVDGKVYLGQLAQTYETNNFYTHASSGFHAPDTNWIYTGDIAALRGGSLITFIGGCHSGDVIEANGGLTLSTTYVFKNVVGLAATGTTWSYGPEELAVVTSGLGRGETVGRAWFAKQKMRNTPDHYRKQYGHEAKFDDTHHMYGEILFGDPFVRLSR
jgi:hypothetical protein